MSEIKVKSLIIQYPDGSSKVLSIEDAEALYDQLHELFGIEDGKPVFVPMPEPVIIRERTPWFEKRWITPQVFMKTTPNTGEFERPQLFCSASEPKAFIGKESGV